MTNRWINRVLLIIFLTCYIAGWCCGYYRVAFAEDNFIFTISFDPDNQGLNLSSKNIKVLFNFYECKYNETAETKVEVVGLVGSVQANTDKSKNDAPYKGSNVTFALPRGQLFLLEAIPLTENGGPVNYQRQYFHQKHKLSDVTKGMLLDTSQGTGVTRAFSLEKGYKISGTVTSASTNSAIEDIKIKLFDESKVLVLTYGVSGPTGAYSIAGLAAGKYYLWADGAPKGYVRKFYPSADNFNNAEQVTITNADVPGKNFSLEIGNSVSGQLIDPSGNPLQHTAEVYLLDAIYGVPIGMYFHDPNITDIDEVDERVSYMLNGRDLGYANFKSDGKYSIGGIPEDIEGSAVLLARDPSGNYSTLYYKDAYFIDNATLISLGNIEDQNFDFNFSHAGKISGSVKDVGGNKLEKITVRAIDATNEQHSFTAYTDANGHYEVMGLPPVDYKVQVVDDANHKYLWQYYNEKLNFTQAAKIHLTEQNLSIAHIDFVLPIGGRIGGRVESSSGDALADIAVQAFRLGTGNPLVNYPVNTTASGIAVTDNEGKYLISGLPSGSYVLYARPPADQNYIAIFYEDSYTLNGAMGDITLVDPNQLITGLDFSLKKGGRIKGRINGIPTDLENELKGNLHVDLHDSETGQLMQSTTEEIDPNNWTYIIRGIPKGEYKIGVSDIRTYKKMLKKYYKESDTQGVFKYIEASAFIIDPITDPNAVMSLDLTWDTMGAKIKGNVKDEEGEPITRIRIDAYQEEESTGKLLNIGIYNYTDNDGDYTLSGLLPGKYVLKASDDMFHIYATEYYDDPNLTNVFNVDNAQGLTVSLENSPYSPYNFRLNKFGVIKGVITKGESGLVFENALVYLYRIYNGNILVQTDLTDDEGEYKFTGLDEGSYKVRAFDPEKGFVPRFHTLSTLTYAFDIEDGDPVLVDYDNPASTESINLCLNLEGAEISGRIERDDDHTPLANVFIYLYQKMGQDEWSLVGDYTIADYTVFTDPNGEYKIKGLPSGTYKAMAWDYEENYYPVYYGDVNQNMGSDINLDQEIEVRVDFSLLEIELESQKELTIDLSEGLNLFCLPAGVPLWPPFYDVSSLLSQWLQNIGSGVTNIFNFDAASGEWKDRFSGFFLENGKGYLAYSCIDKKIRYEGTLPQNQKIDLYQGMNIVGNMVGNNNYDSYQVIKDLLNEAYGIRRYDVKQGKWFDSIQLWGKPAGKEFDILPAEGYILNMKSPRWLWSPPVGEE